MRSLTARAESAVSDTNAAELAQRSTAVAQRLREAERQAALLLAQAVVQRALRRLRA